jgi:hypothetical protein
VRIAVPQAQIAGCNNWKPDIDIDIGKPGNP